MGLEGSERKLLHAIVREQGNAHAGYVEDSKIAEIAYLCIEEVRDCLETLEGKECVQRSVGVGGHSAYITAKGRQELRRAQDINGDKRAESSLKIVESPLKFVPKGLRSFDAEDKDFFLELLPGPRRGDGLPESVHFWKVRIEEMDPDKTFRVGYIFGPSGCGKSSLVKAGLLPRLSKPIIPIYIEATGEDTEARLLKGLRKHNPDLSADLDLRTALVAARDKIREGSNKILLVIDQFEQWYHAKGAEPGTELAKALSECDGGRVQAIILVRDDYSMALHRFMAVIGVRQNQDQNFAVVDLFDLQHARKVLIAFGRGYGMLPDDPKEMTCAQNEFLDRTIKGLSQEGRVVSVRLALFAEMLKGKPWTPETLKQVRGAEGVGVTFLEETFSARTAPPPYRIHQKAAQAVLRALLPETGSNIKGNMQSYDKLLVVSGYGSRPNEFDELLRILNCELRLISPIEPEESESDGPTKTPVGEKFFLLTHDYLVQSIREWLTRKQKETRRGRAELLLVDRSSLWNAKPENRHLPSLLEWTNIERLTKQKDWTEPQRKMMRRAGRVHGLRTLALAALIALITWGGYEAYGSFQARALVDSLKTASTAEVPDIVKNLSGYYRWARRPLSDLLSSTEEQSCPHLHAGLALLPVDPGQVEYLSNRMLNANPTELPVIREALRGHQWTLIERLWGVLENTQADRDQRFRAAWALAGYVADETEERWVAASRFITDRLLASVIENPSSYAPLMEMLRPIRKQLLASLATTFRDPQRTKTERYFATNILADYASDQPDLLADLLMDADFKAYAAFFPIAQRQAAKTLPLFQAEIRKQATIPDSDKDSEMVKDRLAERQARAAITLLRMGKAGEIIPLLRHSADPRLRSFIVNWLKPLGAVPQVIADALEHIDPSIKPTRAEPPKAMDAVLFHPETSQRRALILALGQFGEEILSAEDRRPLIDKLLTLYENDPDAGIHGAAEWTLWKWGRQERLKEKDAAMRGKEPGEHRWYVNGQGQTLALIEGPVEFRMGSPPNEPNRSLDETPHRQTIPRRLFIATKEVTVEQFQQFVQADLKHHEQYGTPQHLLDQYTSPKQGGPMICVSWYAAAAYCNWLSRKENLPECYEPNDEGRYAEGMKIRADALQRPGYRLPTEAEWEYACRAGAITSRYYGFSTELLRQYTWYLTNIPSERAQPCGSLLPNDLGLFDMLGNMYEWCNGRYEAYPPDKGGNVDDNIKIHEEIKETNPRLIRGGTFFYIPPFLRSAIRRGFAPSYRDIFIGFRPSRTSLKTRD